MTSYTRRSKTQWQQLIEAQQSSGLSQQAFCQQEGLSLATFSSWRRKLKEDAALSITATDIKHFSDPWVELPSSAVANDPWRIELDLGNGVCLRLSQAG